MKKATSLEHPNSSNPMNTWNELNAELTASLHSIVKSTPGVELQRSLIKEQLETELITIRNELDDINQKLDTLYYQKESVEGKEEALRQADDIATEHLNKNSKNSELLKTQKITGDAWQKANNELTAFLEEFEKAEANLIAEQQQLKQNLKQTEELFKRAQQAPSFFTQLINLLSTPNIDKIDIDDETDSLSLEEIYPDKEESKILSTSPDFSPNNRLHSPVGVAEINYLENEGSTNNNAKVNSNIEEKLILEGVIITKEKAIQVKEEEISKLNSAQTSIKQNVNILIKDLEDKAKNVSQKIPMLKQEKETFTLKNSKMESEIAKLDEKIRRKNRDKENRGEYQPILDLLKSVQHYIYRFFGFKIEREVFEAERKNLKEEKAKMDNKVMGINNHLKTL